MFKRILTWYFLLCKRLLKRTTFVLILLLIPLFSVFVTITSYEDSGFVRIALAAEDSADPVARGIIDDLREGSNFLKFEFYDDPEDAVQMVRSSEVDTAWIFPSKMSKRIDAFAKGDRDILTRIYLREDGMLVKASREKLFGAIYKELSYAIYKTAVNKLDISSDLISEEKLLEAYTLFAEDNGIISFVHLDQTSIDLDGYNYTVAPVRGLLVTVMLLCGMAATLFYLEDEKKHTFATLTSSKRFLVFFGNNLAAVSISAIFVVLAIFITGGFTSLFPEVVSMLLLVTAVTGFTVLLGSVTKSTWKVALLIPTLLVLSLVLCPIFFNLTPCEPLQALIPTYMYLCSIGNLSMYLLPMIIYSVIALSIAFIVYKFRKR